MNQTTVFSRLLAVSSLVLGAVAFTGCGAPKPVPPVFSLYGYQRLVVIPFENQTRDASLAKDVQDEMTSEVVGVGAVPVIEAAQVSAYLRSIKANAATLQDDAQLRKRLGDYFKADILMMGTATGYNEFLKDTAPQRVDGKWGFYTNRKVVVNATAKLVDVTSGSLLWTQKSQGYSYYNTFNPLPIPGGLEVPAELQQFANLATLVRNRIENKDDREPVSIDKSNPDIPLYLNSHHFSELRGKAIYETVSYIVGDFRSSGGWTPNLRGNSGQ